MHLADFVVPLAPQAQARIKILEKLPQLEPPEQEDTESFKLGSIFLSLDFSELVP